MSQHRGDDSPPGTGHTAGMSHDALLVESKRVSDLPGLWAKTVTIAPDQIGFLASKGVIVRELGTGATRVCNSFFGLTGGGKEVRLFRVRPFQLRIDMGRLIPGAASTASDNPNHQLVEVTALIANPSLLYAVLDGQSRLYASQLAETISVAVGTTLHEAPEEAVPMDELNMPIRRVMAERGLQVDRIELVDSD